jgi:hypothetical protein
LAFFDRKRKEALARNQCFIKEGVAHGKRPDLIGSGLAQSAGGWTELRLKHLMKQHLIGDERILGDFDFIGQVLISVIY